MYSDRRVVITGIGALTPIGLDTETFWKNLCEGKSGAKKVTHMDVSPLASQIAAPIYDFDPLQHLDKKAVRKNDRFVQFALVTGRQALADSGLEVTEENSERIGVLIGCGIGGLQTIEDQQRTMLEKGVKRVSPLLIPKIITNMAAGMVAIDLNLKGPNTCIVTACATGTHCLGEAMHVIKRGDADVMLAGGTEAPMTLLGMAGFSNMQALTTRNDEPERASRPFDAERDGFLMGEGAGVLVIEEYESARARGANIYAEVVGYGLSCDAYHITAPDPSATGGSRALKQALRNSEIAPDQIDYINAHGTSTQLNDKLETQAIKTVFGERAKSIPVSSNKSMIGHLLGAAGAVEAAATALTIRDGIIPPTTNYEHPDPECDLDYVPNEAREANVDIALSNSLGFGGHNCSLVLRKI